MATLPITDQLSIDDRELTFRASRAGGPGGQHVNTSSTRVELVWNVAESPSLTEEQRARILEKLANRISGEGNLSIASAGSRSQQQNREEALDRFTRLVREALHVPKRRKRTRPTAASREKRLQAKKRRSEIKRLRKPTED